MIVVEKLVSASLRDASEFQDTRIEKMLVNVLDGSASVKMISEGEYDKIFWDAVRTLVKLTPDELEMASEAVGWCDVCKGWETE